MLQRLVQTNLLYGAYPIAEKYLDMLEQTKYYKEWARDHRRYLWNDEAIANDSLLNIKRNCILKSNLLSESLGLPEDLERIARQNPAHQASLHYASAFYLLSKELLLFQELVEEFYGTDALPVLPQSFQEAIIILSEQDPAYWERFAIPASVIQRFNEFKRQILANQNNSAALPALLKRSFGDTYWYYYMFI
jgi:hypothetical protein